MRLVERKVKVEQRRGQKESDAECLTAEGEREREEERRSLG